MPAIHDFGLILKSQVPIVIHLAIASLLAHKLNQNDYGIFNLLKNIVLMGYLFVSFNFDRIALNLHNRHSLKIITNTIIPIRGILFVAFAMIITAYTTSINLDPLLIALAVACILPAIFDIKYSFDINQSVNKDITLTVFRAAPLLILVPILTLLDSGKKILTLYFLLLLTGYFLYVYLQHRQAPNLLGKVGFSKTKEFLFLGIFTFLGSTTASLNLYVPTLIIEAELSLISLAVYSVTLTIYTGVLSIVTLIVRISVSNYLKSNKLTYEFIDCLKKIFPVLIGFTAVFFFYGEVLIGIVFGGSYTLAYELTLILLLGLFFSPISIFFNSLLIVKGLTLRFMLVQFGGLTVNLFTILILINNYRLMGVVISMISSIVAMALLSVLLYKTQAKQPAIHSKK